MKSKSKIIFFFLILFCFIIHNIESKTEIEEIKLDPKKSSQTVKISAEVSPALYYIKGGIDQDKQYLLISLIDNSVYFEIISIDKPSANIFLAVSIFALYFMAKPFASSYTYLTCSFQKS